MRTGPPVRQEGGPLRHHNAACFRRVFRFISPASGRAHTPSLERADQTRAWLLSIPRAKHCEGARGMWAKTVLKTGSQGQIYPGDDLGFANNENEIELSKRVCGYWCKPPRRYTSTAFQPYAPAQKIIRRAANPTPSTTRDGPRPRCSPA